MNRCSHWWRDWWRRQIVGDAPSGTDDDYERARTRAPSECSMPTMTARDVADAGPTCLCRVGWLAVGCPVHDPILEREA